MINSLNFNFLATTVRYVLHVLLQVQFATQAVFEKLPLQPHPTAQLSGFLFLQLTVSDLGICLPLHNLTQVCVYLLDRLLRFLSVQVMSCDLNIDSLMILNYCYQYN